MAIAVGYFYDLTLLSDRAIYINAKKSVLVAPERMKMQSVYFTQSVLLCEHIMIKKVSKIT